MRRRLNPFKSSIARWFGASAAIAVGLVLVWALAHRSGNTSYNDLSATTGSNAPHPPPLANRNIPDTREVASTPPETGGPSRAERATRLRPLGVARESDKHQWTGEDGKDTNVIRRLAHNVLEYQRMVEENARVVRRQLVYRKETAAALVQRARFSREPIRQIALPGLDGHEIRFEITLTDLNASGQEGTFAGHVAGRVDSLVTLAFKGGREAFTVISPSERVFLQGDPREPGELIVKSIDPETYAAGVCGTP